MPEMKPVDSSNIEAIGYDADNQVAHVKFKNGGTYTYSGVSQSAYDALASAKSVGSHLHTHFKKTYSVDRA